MKFVATTILVAVALLMVPLWATPALAQSAAVTTTRDGHKDFDFLGVGEFLARDTYAGKPIIVRFMWTLRSGDHPHFEQAFSPDNGRTWETNWICDYARVPASSKGVWSATP